MGVEELSLRTARVQTAKQAFVRPGRKKTNTASSGFHPTKARGHGIKKRQWLRPTQRPTQSRSKKPAAATATSSTSSTSPLRKAGFFCPAVSESRFATAHRIHARQMHLMKEAISGHLWSSVAIGSKRARCTSRAHGAARGRNQHAISMQSACNQHAPREPMEHKHAKQHERAGDTQVEQRVDGKGQVRRLGVLFDQSPTWHGRGLE